MAPLYVAPSTTPSNANNPRQVEFKQETEKTPDPYRLSHFVAPLYVAPSPTPSNANNPRQVRFLQKNIENAEPLKKLARGFALLGVVEEAT